MKHPKHQARMVALQGLYQLDIQREPDNADIASVLEPLLAEAELSDKAAAYTHQLTAGAWSRHERYDQIIAGASEHWQISRMPIVDRNLLRLALYELIEQPDVPARVVIDEAIELGRTFGAAETPQFINGVLDAIWKRDPACQTARIAREALDRRVETRKTEDSHGTV